jgi:hypothetical protein
MVEPHALEALIEAGEQILARAPFAVGAGPHIVAGLSRDHELVAIGVEIRTEDTTEILFGRAVWRAVIVGEVEMGDAPVEGATQNGALRLERVDAAEILPQPERNCR